ncbi:MAG TPA: dethiobiotin synthase [Jatrophihabitans sp.]|nr:dethiobiotin synthase [Jatrophihabitans sp.]
MNCVVVTGTGTGVGKTIATAAIAACSQRQGRRVAVVKPVQTGARPGEPADLAEVARLTGLADLHEYQRYREPLAPATAARRLGEAGPGPAQLADRIGELADRDLVVIEGAGGSLVRFDAAGHGIIELANTLADRVAGLRVVLVCSSRLGGLHDAAASARPLAEAGLGPHQLVIGDWPATPGLADRCNLHDLPDYAGAPIGGVLAADAGLLEGARFAEYAVRSLTPALGGRLDAADFVRSHAAAPPGAESL